MTYRLSEKDGKLIVTSLRADPVTLTPAATDQFESDEIRATLLRDASGKVSGIAVASGRVRDIRFARQ